MRSFRHWTPRYVLNRLRVMAFERRHPDAPWLTPSMVRILDGWLHDSDRGFEWGSGRSTVWFGRRVEQLTSIEHDAAWHPRVGEQLVREGLDGRVDHRLASIADEDDADSDYVRAIAAEDDASLDFCLIDGVARDHCAALAVPKIKPGGLLIVDNANWYLPRAQPSSGPGSRGSADGHASPTWRVFHDAVARWRCAWTTSGVTDTAFWIKPVVVGRAQVRAGDRAAAQVAS